MFHFTRHTHRFCTLLATALLLVVSLAQTPITTAQTDDWVWEKVKGKFDAKLHCIARNPINGDIYVCHYRGAMVSRDNGATWNRAGTFSDETDPIMPFGHTWGIAFDSQGRIFLSSDDTFKGSQLVMSTDDGYTWHRITPPSLHSDAAGANETIWDVIVDDDDRVYYCTGNRIYRSIDTNHVIDPQWNLDADGNMLPSQPDINWQSITPSGDPANGDFGGLGTGHANLCNTIVIHGDSLYVGMREGLWRSNNYDIPLSSIPGASDPEPITWSRISDGAMNDTTATLNTYGVESIVFGTDGTLYAGQHWGHGAYVQRLFKSSDHTTSSPTWEEMPNILADVLPFITSNGTLLASTSSYGGNTISRFDPVDSTWDTIELYRWHSPIIDFVQLPNGSILGATWGRGVLVSHDDGLTWDDTSEGMSFGQRVVDMKSDGSRLYSTDTKTLAYSDDNGYSWQSCGLYSLDEDIPVGLRTQTAFIAPDDTIYVANSATDHNNSIRVWYSTDDCATWTLTGLSEGSAIPASYIPITSLAMNGQGELFATVSGQMADYDGDENYDQTGGVYKYDAVQDSWSQLPLNGLYDNQIDRMFAHKILADDHGNLLVNIAYEPASMFISSDNGGNWTRMMTGVPDGYHAVSNFEIAPNGDLLIITANSGVFKSVWNGTGYNDWESLGLETKISGSYVTADAQGNVYASVDNWAKVWLQNHGYYTLPAGETEWVQIDADNFNQGGRNIWVHPNPSPDGTKLIIQTDNGMMRSCGADACPPPDGLDTDGDGLLDEWEINGYDADSDGVIDVDLPAMGADPMHKDVFVELDYMGATHHASHRPNVGAIQDVVEAFNNAPVLNPDGTMGIHLHVDYGTDAPLTWGSGATWGDLSGGNELPHQRFICPDGDSEQIWDGFDEIKAVNFDSARSNIFRYNVWAHRLCQDLGTSSGMVRGIGGSDFIVSLGLWRETRVGLPLDQATTFMHELGHSLGLRHGGEDHVNHKPNYVSVMGYPYQVGGITLDGHASHIDFSRVSSTLDENSLVESDGLPSHPSSAVSHALFRCQRWYIHTALNSATDFNCNGSMTDVGAADLNGDGEYTLLESWNDWENLVFDGGMIGLPEDESADGADGDWEGRPIHFFGDIRQGQARYIENHIRDAEHDHTSEPACEATIIIVVESHDAGSRSSIHFFGETVCDRPFRDDQLMWSYFDNGELIILGHGHELTVLPPTILRSTHHSNDPVMPVGTHRIELTVTDDNGDIFNEASGINIPLSGVPTEVEPPPLPVPLSIRLSDADMLKPVYIVPFVLFVLMFGATCVVRGREKHQM